MGSIDTPHLIKQIKHITMKDIIGRGIKNPQEKVFYYRIVKHFKSARQLYRVPTQQLLNLRRDKNSFIVSQTPYTNQFARTSWTDFSLFNEAAGLDMRVEVRSLDPKRSALSNKTRQEINEINVFRNSIPEKTMMFVLIGEGFDELINEIESLGEYSHKEIIIARTIEGACKYIESQL